MVLVADHILDGDDNAVQFARRLAFGTFSVELRSLAACLLFIHAYKCIKVPLFVYALEIMIYRLETRSCSTQ